MPQPPRVWGLRLAELKLKTERSSTPGWLGEKHDVVWRRLLAPFHLERYCSGLLEHHVCMSKMKAKKESDKTLISNVKKEMAKPRMAKSTRGKKNEL
jgi:hypothetical protein